MTQQDVRDIIIAIVVGAIISAISLVLEYKSGWFQQTPTGGQAALRKRVFLGLGIFIIVGGIAYLSLQWFTSDISIESLRDRATIPESVKVNGGYKNLSANTEIWVFVKGGKDQTYFLFPAVKFNDGTWEARSVMVGRPDDTGAPFRLGVISADQAASAELHRNPNNREALPSGTQIFHEIAVFRDVAATTPPPVSASPPEKTLSATAEPPTAVPPSAELPTAEPPTAIIASPPTSIEPPVPTSGVSPSGVIGFDFENGVDGWTSNEIDYKPVTITTTMVVARQGHHSLEVKAPLYGSGSGKYDNVPKDKQGAYTQTVLTGYFDRVIPEGMQEKGPYDWNGKHVTCAVYLPASLATAQSPHTNVHLFVKDISQHNQQSKRIDILNEGPEKTTDKWLLLSLTIGQPGDGGIDKDFRPNKIMALGISVEAASGSVIEYEGSYYVDNCTITG